jgi:hypothetical protein
MGRKSIFSLNFGPKSPKITKIKNKNFVVMQSNLDFKVSNERSGPHELLIRHI